MATLYEIDGRVRDVIESGFSVDGETGEVWDATDLEALQEERSTKMEACALWLKEQKALADAMRAEEMALSGRRRAVEARVERMRQYLAGFVSSEPHRAFETPRVRLSLRRSKRVDVFDSDELPDRFTVEKVTQAVDKRAVMDALKAGEDVPGARIVETQSLQVR